MKNDVESSSADENSADNLRKNANRLIAKVRGYELQESSWGFYAYNDAPPIFCGSGLGGFAWFDTQDEVLDFIESAIPFTAPTTYDLAELVADVRAVIQPYRHGTIDLALTVHMLNALLNRHTRFKWIGTYQGLEAGACSFSSEFLARFWENQGVRPRKIPETMSADQKAEFRKFIFSGEY